MYFWWDRVSVESPRGATVLVFRWLGLESPEEPMLTRLGRSFLCSPHWGEPPVLSICGELWGAQPCPASWSQQGGILVAAGTGNKWRVEHHCLGKWSRWDPQSQPTALPSVSLWLASGVYLLFPLRKLLLIFKAWKLLHTDNFLCNHNSVLNFKIRHHYLNHLSSTLSNFEHTAYSYIT